MEDNKFFTFIKPCLDFIDNGSFYRKPFKWLYMLIAALNLFFPLYLLYQAISKDFFKYAPGKLIAVFILAFFIVAFACWIGFQIWWDRKDKVASTSTEGDNFVATPVFSHFIQTLGEFVGVWIAIVGFGVSLLLTLLGSDSYGLSGILEFDFISAGILSAILAPVYGFLIVVFSRFLAEQFRALAAIANNTANKGVKKDATINIPPGTEV